MTIDFFTNVNHVTKLRFVTDERTNGDIEALADAMRALKKLLEKTFLDFKKWVKSIQTGVIMARVR